jgi:hypothetical protein
MLRDKKKGQTLVEVIVALGIVFIVFAATANLTINSIHLILQARNETEAIYLAQQETAVALNNLNESCYVANTASDSMPNINTIEQDSVTGLYYKVMFNDYNNDQSSSDYPQCTSTCNGSNDGFTSSNLVKVIVNVYSDAQGTQLLYTTNTYVGSTTNVQ